MNATCPAAARGPGPAAMGPGPSTGRGMENACKQQCRRRNGASNGERKSVHLLFSMAWDRVGDQGLETTTTVTATVRTPNLCGK